MKIIENEIYHYSLLVYNTIIYDSRSFVSFLYSYTSRLEMTKMTKVPRFCHFLNQSVNCSGFLSNSREAGRFALNDVNMS